MRRENTLKKHRTSDFQKADIANKTLNFLDASSKPLHTASAVYKLINFRLLTNL